MSYIKVYLVSIFFLFSGILGEIKAQEKESMMQSPTIESLIRQLDSLQRVRDAEKLKFEKEIKQLNSQIDKLKTKSGVTKSEERIKTLNSKIDSMSSRLRDDSVIFNAQNTKINQLRDSLVILSNDLQALEVFRKPFLMNLFEESEEYMRLPYSKIDANKLIDLRNGLSPYEADTEVSKAISRINTAMKYKEEVISLTDGITTAYDAHRIAKARNGFKILEMHKKEFSPAQWGEFDELDKFLSRYKPSLIAFQSIINEINKCIDPYSGAENERARRDCIEDIKNVFIPYQKKEIELGINNIPYLRSRFEKYQKWATSNPLKKGEDIKTIESEILNLKITD